MQQLDDMLINQEVEAQKDVSVFIRKEIRRNTPP